jgi:tRNA(Arg) A34 adenosine deaminase TadA
VHHSNDPLDVSFMQYAIAEAIAAKAVGELPIGAVLVSGGQVIARNRCREMARQTVLAHAEMHAVDDACRALGRNNLHDCTIYCTNEPCLMCAAAIFQARIAAVVIGASRDDLPQIFRRRSLRIEHLAADSGYVPTIVRNVMSAEVLKLFADLSRT